MVIANIDGIGGIAGDITVPVTGKEIDFEMVGRAIIQERLQRPRPGCHGPSN